MTAASAAALSARVAEQRSHEPSMEEILASIRRIIADDQAAPPTAHQPAADLRPLAPERASAAPVVSSPASDPEPQSRELHAAIFALPNGQNLGAPEPAIPAETSSTPDVADDDKAADVVQFWPFDDALPQMRVEDASARG